MNHCQFEIGRSFGLCERYSAANNNNNNNNISSTDFTITTIKSINFTFGTYTMMIRRITNPNHNFYVRNSNQHIASRIVILSLLILTIVYILFGIVALTVVIQGNGTTTNNNGIRKRILASSVSIPKYINYNIETQPIQKLQRKFPIRVTVDDDDDDDWEDILHPGIAFSGMERLKALLPPEKFETISKTIRVPKFWNPPEYHNVRSFLGDNGRRYMTTTEAQLLGSIDPITEQETIFISVASYRDSECTPTVESIYARAKYPRRIRVAVVDQMDPSEDANCAQPALPCNEDPNQILCQYSHLIDVYQAPAHLMVGPVFARHIAHRMYRGEYYSMQVDAHVHFIQDWDQNIIQQWKSTNNEMAVLSTYMTDIDKSIDPITHESLRTERNILCGIEYDGTGLQRRLTLKRPTKQRVPSITGTPLLHPFWSAGFSFSRGHFVVSVPYDQHLPMLFQGEESGITVRGFTYGYDFYAPERSVAFHIYAIKNNIGRRNRHKFWENGTLYGKNTLEKSTARLNGITGLVPTAVVDNDTSSSYIKIDEDKYGLGHVRSRERYFQTFGIHPDKSSSGGTVEGHLCSFVQKDMHQLFTPYLRPDGIGIDYNNIDYTFQDPFSSHLTK
jgi:hypothetical protein